MRKKHLCILGVVLALWIVAMGFKAYFNFVSEKIYEESSNHLTEIYNQVNKSFHELVSINWKNMQGWVPYLQETNDDKKVLDFLNEQKEMWGFSDFYFISYDGFYHTLDGNSGYMNMNDQLPKLILDKKPVVADGMLNGNTELTLFAVPASGSFRGYDYKAIAISFDNRDMIEALKISAFEGRSDSYVVYPNGRIFIDTAGKFIRSKFNFLSWLDNESDISDEKLNYLRRELKNGKSGIMTFRMNRQYHYLIYEPVGFSDWMVIGVVQSSVVNAGMSQVQMVTIFVFAGILSVVCVIMLVLMIHRNRVTLADKDTEIQYREELFSTLSKTVDDVFLMLNAREFKAVYISPNVEKLLGISAEEVRGSVHSLDRLLNMSEPVNVLDLLPSLNPGEIKEWDREYIHSKTGSVRWFHVLAYRTKISGKENYVLVLSDRTADRKKNRALKNALDIAKSANKAKSNFLANMSHDIRTPLNAIMGFAALLSRDAENVGKVRKYAGKISFSGQYLLDLISDILDMSKIESGQTSLNITKFGLYEFMDEIYEIVLPQTKAKKQSFKFSISGNVPSYVVGDKTRIGQILLNLLSNAVKYTQIKGKIRLTLEELNQSVNGYVHLRFIVEDNGFGMSEGFTKIIFEPFERENTELTKEIQGTGLGMAITKSLVDLMGGTITVCSAPGEGSVFTVDLELQNAEKAENAQTHFDESAKHFSENSISGLHVLICEDNDINAEILQELLNTEGITSTIASNGQKAVEIFESSEPGEFDLIFMDVQMPFMDGYEATRRIRSCPHPEAETIPIIAMTANAFEEDVQRSLAAGMNAHISKPIDMDKLVQTVLKFLD